MKNNFHITKKLILALYMLSISNHLNAMDNPDEFHQIERDDMTVLLSRSNPAALLAYLCDKITKEQAQEKVNAIVSTNPELITQPNDNGLARICSKSKKATIMRECFIHCWPRSGDGERSGCAFRAPSPLEVIKRKIENGCTAEGCLYVHKAFEEQAAFLKEEQDKKSRQLNYERAKQTQAEYNSVVEKFKLNNKAL